MRVAVVDVTPLVTVRETFRPGWRMLVATWFLLFVLLLWSMIQKADPDALFAEPRLRTGTLVLVIPLIAVLGVAFPRKGIRAQFLFTALAAINTLAALGLVAALITSSRMQVTPAEALAGILGYWILFGRHLLASIQSLVPLRRWRAHRLRLALSRRLWSGEWRGEEETPHLAGAGEPQRGEWRPYVRLAWGWVALVLGIACGALAAISLSNLPLANALQHLDPGEAIRVLRTGPLDRHQELPPFHPAYSVIIPLFLLGWLGLRTFSAAWERWRRRTVPVRRSAMRITESGVLLLRSFREEEKGVPGRIPTLRTLPLAAHERGYTFVDLAVERLSVVGPVKLFGWSENLPPPRGGDRYFIDRWEEEMGRVIPLARMIVVLFGTTDSLAWELNVVREGGFLPKTVFLLPPDLSPLRARRRWTALGSFLCPEPEHRAALMKTIKPRRVLAACAHPDLLLVLVGRQVQSAYESALDLATLFTIAGPDTAGGW